MNTHFRQYKIFVSSPGDVQKERQLVDEIVNRINLTLGDSLKVNLQVVRWEKMPPETTEESIQEGLNRKIAECNFFLLILNKRYGSIEKGFAISNTEREINTILSYTKQQKKKKILSYFRKLKFNGDPGEQETKILKLRKQLLENNWLCKDYDSERCFERDLTHDLYEILLKMNLSSYKIEQLKKFWKVGKVDGQAQPNIAIIYPPVPREWMALGDYNIWQKRLLPNLFFEDFKALHKILKNLSMVGLSDYRVYSKFDLPSNFDQSNVVWICLPRQRRGLDELNSQSEKRFTITERTSRKDAFIEWTDSHGNPFVIKSPLYKYLKRQRPDVDPHQDWNRFLGNIIAKDYAVIARFDRPLSTNANPGTEQLKSFYIAGIHGLGTWGATWYIDRKYGFFSSMNMDDDVQILVEVEFKDGKISNVKDVSDMDREYFDKEQNMKTINHHIEVYRDNLR